VTAANIIEIYYRIESGDFEVAFNSALQLSCDDSQAAHRSKALSLLEMAAVNLTSDHVKKAIELGCVFLDQPEWKQDDNKFSYVVLGIFCEALNWNRFEHTKDLWQMVELKAPTEAYWHDRWLLLKTLNDKLSNACPDSIIVKYLIDRSSLNAEQKSLLNLSIKIE
jgi:hypothetical protein